MAVLSNQRNSALKQFTCDVIEFSFQIFLFSAIFNILFCMVVQFKEISVLSRSFYWSFLALAIFRLMLKTQPKTNTSKRLYSLLHVFMLFSFICSYLCIQKQQSTSLKMIESELTCEFERYTLQNNHGVDYIQMSYLCCGLNNKNEYGLNSSMPMPLSCCKYNNCEQPENVYKNGCNRNVPLVYQFVYITSMFICRMQGMVSLFAAIFFLVDSCTKMPRLDTKSKASYEQLI